MLSQTQSQKLGSRVAWLPDFPPHQGHYHYPLDSFYCAVKGHINNLCRRGLAGSILCSVAELLGLLQLMHFSLQDRSFKIPPVLLQRVLLLQAQGHFMIRDLSGEDHFKETALLIVALGWAWDGDTLLVSPSLAPSGTCPLACPVRMLAARRFPGLQGKAGTQTFSPPLF